MIGIRHPHCLSPRPRHSEAVVACTIVLGFITFGCGGQQPKSDSPQQTVQYYPTPQKGPAGNHVDDFSPLPSSQLPAFPWPPPKASAEEVLPSSLFEATHVNTLGDIAGVLSAGLDQTGYVERSYYSVPYGFSLVTRLEQMYPDGRPKPPPGRFSVLPVPLTRFTLKDYLRALFKANPGYYRLIVFVTTSQPFSQSPAPPPESWPKTLLSRGSNTLTQEIAEELATTDTRCTALIYEFSNPPKGAGSGPVSVDPSDLDAKTHLQQSGLWNALHLK